MVNADWLTHKRWGGAGHLVLIKGIFDNQRQSDNWRTIEGSIVKRFGAEFTPGCSGFKMPRCSLVGYVVGHRNGQLFTPAIWVFSLCH